MNYNNLYIILENVRSAQNVGSIFRTCDAMGVKKILLTGISPIPPNREILKTALGSTESVSWEYFKNVSDAIQSLNNELLKVVGIEQTAESIALSLILPERNYAYVLILGNEIEGVSEEALKMCDFTAEIPQFGIKKSLNVSVAAGIAAWHFSNLLRHNE